MKRALCLLIICLFCTGCSALPPEERAFCVVLLIDGGAQECTVRVRIPTYQQNGGYQTLSATGATLTDALRTLESAAQMRLHWGQLRLIVLSRAWAAEIPIVRTLSDLSGVENLRLHASVAVTEEDIQLMRGCADTMREKWAQGEFFIQEDKTFHLTLFRPLQNDVLLSLLEAIWAVDDGFELEKKQPHLEYTISKHEAIIAALENHSYPAFARAMEAHFSSGKYLGMTSYEEF